MLTDLAFFCLSNLFWKGHGGTCKDVRWVRLPITLIIQIHHPERPLAIQHRQPSGDMYSSQTKCLHVTSRWAAFAFFPHVLFPKTQEACYVIPGSNYFLGYVVFISNWCGPPTARKSCPTDCISQTAPWLTASLTATGSLKKTWNVKDLECKITSLMRRGAGSSARFSSVHLKGRPCSLPVCYTTNCLCSFCCFYLRFFVFFNLLLRRLTLWGRLERRFRLFSAHTRICS